MPNDTQLKNFAKNTEQKEAVKEFIFSLLEPQNWLYTLDTKLSDSEYGQRVKAVVKAKALLEEAFNQIDGLLEPEKPKQSTNEAR